MSPKQQLPKLFCRFDALLRLCLLKRCTDRHKPKGSYPICEQFVQTKPCAVPTILHDGERYVLRTVVKLAPLRGVYVQITEVRIKLVTDVDDRLRAFCSITIDSEFVVRDLKIIQGQRSCFVAMPSRKLTEKCIRCTGKNEIRARYCSHCGAALPTTQVPEMPAGRNRMFADIAHPINASCRERIEQTVLTAYEEEVVRSKQPGYVCRYDEFDDSMLRGVIPQGDNGAH